MTNKRKEEIKELEKELEYFLKHNDNILDMEKSCQIFLEQIKKEYNDGLYNIEEYISNRNRIENFLENKVSIVKEDSNLLVANARAILITALTKDTKYNIKILKDIFEDSAKDYKGEEFIPLLDCPYDITEILENTFELFYYDIESTPDNFIYINNALIAFLCNLTKLLKEIETIYLDYIPKYIINENMDRPNTLSGIEAILNFLYKTYDEIYFLINYLEDKIFKLSDKDQTTKSTVLINTKSIYSN